MEAEVTWVGTGWWKREKSEQEAQNKMGSVLRASLRLVVELANRAPRQHIVGGDYDREYVPALR